MKIYVADLAAYNEGKLHGVEIDLEVYSTAAEIREQIDIMLAKSPIPNAEEWAVHDYEDFPDLGEHPDLDDIETVIRLVDDYDLDLVQVVLEFVSNDVTRAVAMMDRYEGTFQDREEWAYDYLVESLNEISRDIIPYFDFGRWAKDAEINDVDIIDLPSGEIAVFSLR